MIDNQALTASRLLSVAERTRVDDAWSGALNAASSQGLPSNATEEATFHFSEKAEADLHESEGWSEKQITEAFGVIRVDEARQVLKRLAGDDVFASLRNRALTIAAAVASRRFDVAERLLNTESLPHDQRYGVLCMALEELRPHLSSGAIAALLAQGARMYGREAAGLGVASRSRQDPSSRQGSGVDAASLLALRPNVRAVLEGAMTSKGLASAGHPGDIEARMMNAGFHDRVVSGSICVIVTALVRSARTLLAQSSALLVACGNEAAAAEGAQLVKLGRATLDLTSSTTPNSASEKFVDLVLSGPTRRCPWCARLRAGHCRTCGERALACRCAPQPQRCTCKNPRDAMRALARAHALQWPRAIWLSPDSRASLISAFSTAPRRR